MVEKLKNYLQGVRNEVKRVSWPTRQEVISFTILVIILVFVLTLYIWGVDRIIEAILRVLVR
ncbi:MAG TPA: preprotein translocase subunit SecE [Candidatus Acetothermia bacterium]|jgi:preprotein translocase subunit SecE|nr:preprotein translocase subunit SecE [Candidatus Bipolaricaulota bacterium]RLE40970.1 MAG: preprotein translocase subunit SecE [Candidatus Acetothermia bacterium]HDJ29768.1 preprotein translocase subunit SecE [Candidatus Acetothermia bacterium]